MKARTIPRGPGRPQRDRRSPEVRERLVDAAARLVAERGSAATSLRAIASVAGVTPAMVSYYFGDKNGLLEAILDHALERLLQGVRELAAQSSASDAPFVTRFVPFYLRTITRERWIAQLLLREVLSADTPVRARFVERFGRQIAALLPAAVAREIDTGRLRQDLDPLLTVLSVAGMCAFPVLAEPVMGPVFGFRIDPAFVERMAEHTVRLLLEGALPRAESTT